MDKTLELERRNNALRLNTNTVNGRTADIAITTRGSDLYFAISAAMATAGIIFILLASRKPRRDRIFHYITSAIVFVAAIAYFTMGSNLGFTPIEVEWFRSRSPTVRGRFREIFYVRYIDWFITTPLLLIDLLLTAGLPWPKILWLVFVDWIMIVCGLVGALVRSRYKWGYYVFGCAALFYILYELIFTARRHATHLGPDISRAFLYCGSLTVLLWLLYPIAWGLCEGGNYIAPDSEAIFYSVLDFCAKIGFGALLLWCHKDIKTERLGCTIRDYDDDPAYVRGLHGYEVPVGEQEKGVIINGVHQPTTNGVNGVNGVNGAGNQTNTMRARNQTNGVNGIGQGTATHHHTSQATHPPPGPAPPISGNPNVGPPPTRYDAPRAAPAPPIPAIREPTSRGAVANSSATDTSRRVNEVNGITDRDAYSSDEARRRQAALHMATHGAV